MERVGDQARFGPGRPGAHLALALRRVVQARRFGHVRALAPVGTVCVMQIVPRSLSPVSPGRLHRFRTFQDIRVATDVVLEQCARRAHATLVATWGPNVPPIK